MNESVVDARMRPDLSTRPEPPRFLFMTQVWGRAFTESFATAALPSFVASGNLGAFDTRSEFLLFTTESDAEYLRGTKSYRALERLVTVREAFVSNVGRTDPYAIMNDCQRRAAREAEERDLPMVFLQPDIVLSENCLSRVGALWLAGKRCVLIPSVRTTRETLLPEMLAAYGHGDGTLSLPPRAMVGLLLRHIHQIEQACFWDSPMFTTHPSHIFWPVGKSGLIAQYAHMHPLMVHADVKKAGFAGRTLDDDYFISACPDFQSLHMVTDSDEMFCIEFSARLKTIGETRPNRARIDEISAWIARSTNPHQIKLLEKKVLLHAGPLDGAWRTAEREVDTIAGALRRDFGRMPLYLYFHNRALFTAKARGVLESDGAERVGPATRALYRILLASTGVTDRIRGPAERAFRAAARIWRAASFDSVGPNILNPNWLDYAALRRRLATILGNLEGDVLLAGGQSCRVESLISPSAAANCRFHRMDVSVGPNVDRVVDGHDHWGFAAESFDVIVCIDFIESLPDPRAAFDTLLTFLRPGGRIVLCGSALRPMARRGTDRHRFTIHSLIALTQPGVVVDATAQCGGLGTLLGLSLMIWMHQVTNRPLPLRLLKVALAPALVPFILVGNLIFRAVDLLDRTRLFCLKVIVSGVKRDTGKE